MHAFREYLSKHNVRYTEPEMAESLDWIKRKIKQEVFMSSFRAARRASRFFSKPIRKCKRQ